MTGKWGNRRSKHTTEMALISRQYSTCNKMENSMTNGWRRDSWGMGSWGPGGSWGGRGEAVKSGSSAVAPRLRRALGRATRSSWGVKQIRRPCEGSYMNDEEVNLIIRWIMWCMNQSFRGIWHRRGVNKIIQYWGFHECGCKGSCIGA